MKFLVSLEDDGYMVGGLSIPYCCGNIEEAFLEGVIGVASPDKVTSDNLDVNIFKCFPFPEGVVYDKFKINYCPFCGSKIEVEVE